MGVLDIKSLGATVDAVAEEQFFGRKIKKSEAKQAAEWIAARQGQPRSYCGLFAPTDLDYSTGFRVFTGEPVKSGAAIGHIIGEEAMRAMMLLGAGGGAVKIAVNRARERFDGMLKESRHKSHPGGMFCCGICSVSLWRDLLAGGLTDAERRLELGMNALNSHRDGAGKWGIFPFHYTILALGEAASGNFGAKVAKAAKTEIKYAKKPIERVMRRTPDASDKFAVRRRAAMERAMGMV